MKNVKYTNHLNIVIAIIGVIVMAQTLTGTFWNSIPEKQYSLELPAAQPKVQVRTAPRPATGQKRSAVQAPGSLPDAAGAPSPSAVQSAGPAGLGSGRLSTAPVPSNPNPGVFGAPPSANAPAPRVVTIPPNTSTAPSSGAGLQGETSGARSTRGQLPFGGRSNYRSLGGADPRGLNLPPQGSNEAAKRRPDPNVPSPPVRSTMPEQRVQ